ncbi:MAG: hypothetical protein J6Q92_02185, partial [Oscillospiraceae bacterium]|nr:hypothetical protein [Oscillospiraceae bacterium]
TLVIGVEKQAKKGGDFLHSSPVQFADFLSSILMIQLNRDLYWLVDKNQVEHQTGTRRDSDLWLHRLGSQY